jgi:hypothetical protein
LGRWWLNSSWYIVQHDVATGEIVRDPKTGLCVGISPGQSGEILMAFDDSIEPFHPYYMNEKATEEKKIRNVKKKGDEWLRAGDLLSIVSVTLFSWSPEGL